MLKSKIVSTLRKLSLIDMKKQVKMYGNTFSRYPSLQF